MSWSRSVLKPSEELYRKLLSESEVLDSEGTKAIQTMFKLQTKVLDALAGKAFVYCMLIIIIKR